MNANDIIEELSKEYGSHLLLAAYIKRETNCSASDAYGRANLLDYIFEKMCAEYDDEE